MTRLEELCTAIQKNEGWFPFSRAWRNNNPGNLRRSKFADGERGGFAYFPNYATGWLALWYDVWCKCNGNTITHLNGESTLYEFAQKWAPISDGNNPLSYAGKLAEQLDIGTNTKLNYFLQDL